MTGDKIKSYIDSHSAEMIQELSEWIAIPSVSSNLNEVERALDYILRLARGMGFTARSELGGQVGVIECGEGPETLGILTHVDVVPPGDAAEWETDPFCATVKDGKLFGRGAIDDKGPAIASLYAMRAVLESGEPLKKRVQLILGTQEEVEWTDMNAYVKACPLPDYGFTPDDAFPICNIEKGCGPATLKIPFDVPDDGKRYLAAIEAGVAFNAVPSAAWASFNTGEPVMASGRATHASQPEKGENALIALAAKLKTMYEAGGLYMNNALAFMLMLVERFSTSCGEGMGLCSESEYYKGEFVHRNTITPTYVTTESGVLTVSFDVRFPYGMSDQKITDAFKALAAEFGGTAETGLQPAVFVSSSSPFLHAFAEAYEAMTPNKNEYTIAYGGSYAKAMPNVVAWGPLFPDDTDTCHEANEYIRLDALSDCAKIFAQAVASIALSDKSFKQ